jgi:transposase
MEILPHLSVAKRGYTTKSQLVEIVNAILYNLKTGIQWAYLPVSSLFSEVVLSYKSVFWHFRKWCKNGEWQEITMTCMMLRTNAWMDSYRTLLNRFDTTISSWMSFNYIAFMVILLKKVKKRKKFR